MTEMQEMIKKWGIRGLRSKDTINRFLSSSFNLHDIRGTCSMIEVCFIDRRWLDHPEDFLKAIEYRAGNRSASIALVNLNEELAGWESYLVKVYEGNNGVVDSYMIPLENAENDIDEEDDPDCEDEDYY